MLILLPKKLYNFIFYSQLRSVFQLSPSIQLTSLLFLANQLSFPAPSVGSLHPLSLGHMTMSH